MRITQINKRKAIITTYKEYLGTCIECKKKIIYKANSLNYLLCHIWMSSMSRKLFLTCKTLIVGRVFLALHPLLFFKFCLTRSPHFFFCCLVFLAECIITLQLMCYFAKYYEPKIVEPCCLSPSSNLLHVLYNKASNLPRPC